LRFSILHIALAEHVTHTKSARAEDFIHRALGDDRVELTCQLLAKEAFGVLGVFQHVREFLLEDGLALVLVLRLGIRRTRNAYECEETNTRNDDAFGSHSATV
jgi:hypothetical protein